tara:strand:+ start:50 stop:256 length:207 start_codon:yes stop_codon:yes gene_type:complete
MSEVQGVPQNQPKTLEECLKARDQLTNEVMAKNSVWAFLTGRIGLFQELAEEAAKTSEKKNIVPLKKE